MTVDCLYPSKWWGLWSRTGKREAPDAYQRTPVKRRLLTLYPQPRNPPESEKVKGGEDRAGTGARSLLKPACIQREPLPYCATDAVQAVIPFTSETDCSGDRSSA